MESKKLYCLLLIILMYISFCNANNIPRALEVPDEFECFIGKKVFIKYEKPIEGYDVKALVYADSTIATGYRALIDYSKDGKSVSQIETTEFFLPNIDISDLKSGDIISATYDLPDFPENGVVKLEAFENLPFFFIDVDFDGKKELLINKARLGQRNMNAYKPVEIENPYLEFGYWLSNNPYSELDDETIIDYENKVIKTTAIMSGCCAWWITTYKFKEDEFGFEKTLEKHEIQYDENFKPKEIIQTVTFPCVETEWRVAEPSEKILNMDEDN